MCLGFYWQDKDAPCDGVGRFLAGSLLAARVIWKSGFYIGPEVGIHVGRSRSLNFPHYIGFCAGFQKKVVYWKD